MDPSESTPAESASLVTHVHGAISVAVLNRPAVRNALDSDLAARLEDQLEVWASDGGTRAVVLTGTGPAFCAGADIKALHEGRLIFPPDDEETLLDRLYRFPKPVVAAVNGLAVGGGASLALACDIRIGGPDTGFEFNFTRVGLVPEGGTTYTLPRLIGPSRAAQLLYSARRVDAGEALDLGLVDRLVDDTGELVAAAVAVAGECAQGDPEAVAATKELLRHALDAPYKLQRLAERRRFRAAVEARLARTSGP